MAVLAVAGAVAPSGLPRFPYAAMVALAAAKEIAMEITNSDTFLVRAGFVLFMLAMLTGF
jgi:hypothetical protein